MLVATVVALLATAIAPVNSLPASGKWTVDYRTDTCLVSRPFGTGATATTFAIKPAIVMDGGGATLFVLAPNIGSKTIRRGQAVVTLLPSRLQKKMDYVSWIAAPSPLRGYEMEGDAAFVAALGQSTEVSVVAGKDSFAFATGKVEPVLTALATCNADLFKSWGVDPTAKAMPMGSPASWFTDNDYPADAKRRGAQGRTVVVATVSSAGKPTACRVVVSSDAALDKATCELTVNRGRFETDPAKSDRYSILSIRWVMNE